MHNVLLIEDDSRLSENISNLFQVEGFDVTAISTPDHVQSCISDRKDYEVIILDRLLQTHDTKGDVKALKARWPSAPLIVLSAINTPIERTDLINLGADDYLGKPFLSQELIARVKALKRRFAVAPQTFRQLGNTLFDMSKRTLTINGVCELLTTKEYLVVKILSDDMGRVYSRAELLELGWGSDSQVESNVVESTIANLRKRLSSMQSSLQIRNMRNAGYWLEE